MVKTEKVFVKKIYTVPEIQTFYMGTCNVLMTSGTEQERYNYLCPYIPETRCREYNYSVRRKHGILSKASKIPEYFRVSIKGKDECPCKNDCEKYKLYLKFTNESQR